MALERFGVTDETVSVLRPLAHASVCTNSDLCDMASELCTNRTLTSVDLTKCTVSTEAAEALAAALGAGSHNNIRQLSLSDTKLSVDAIKVIAAALCTSQQIELLDLSQNAFRDAGAEYMAKVLRDNDVLRSLNLTATKVGPQGAAALGVAVGTHSKLRTLYLGMNKLRHSGTEALCKGLAVNNSIGVLDLSGNNISADGGLAIAKMLLTNKSIESLNLSKNLISTALPDIMLSLSRRDKLMRLVDISYNFITAEHCTQMSQVLEGSRISVHCLSIEGNKIGDDGLVALFHALKQTPVQFFDVSECMLTARSGVVMADLISLCPLLNSVQVDGNAIGDDALRHIPTAAAKSSALVSLNLERTGMGPETAAALAAACATKGFRNLVLAENPDLTEDCVLRVLDALARTHDVESLDVSDLGLRGSNDTLRALAGVFLSNPRLQSVVMERNPLAAQYADESGVFHRDAALSVVDPADMKTGNNTTVGVSSIAASGAHSTLNHSGALVNTTAANKSQHSVMASTFRPAWSTTVPMAQKSQTAPGADDREDGRELPLVPHPESLHDPLYPGFGRGRFSNAHSIANVNDPLSYNVAVSKGPTPVFKASDMLEGRLFNPPRGKLRTAPYSLAALEGNLAGLPITDDQLRRKFNELDVDGNGYLDRNEFKELYRSFQDYGMPVSEREVERIMASICAWDDEKVSFDEFCILMLKLAAR